MTGSPSPSPRAQILLSRTGRLYVRNLTSSAVTIRVLGPDGSPLVDTYWSFSAYERAGDPRGTYLELTGKGPYLVSSDARLEVTVANGSYRILPLAAAAKWQPSGSWLFQMAPEYVAGSGWLYVRNPLELPVDLWLLGAEGKTLYGDDPWSFEPAKGPPRTRACACSTRKRTSS